MFCLPLIMALGLSSCTNITASCKRDLTLTGADTEQIRQDIQILTSAQFQGRKTGSHGAEKTRRYLISRFEEIGLPGWQNSFSHDFSYQHGFTLRQGANVIAIKPASEQSTEWRIVLAHYDHLGTKGRSYYPGADDNASGVAALLQIAQHIAKQQSNINYLFAAVDAKEVGLYGSQALVKQLQNTIGHKNISLSINLDMVGNPGKRRTIYLEGARRFPRFEELQPLITQRNRLCIRKGHPKSIGASITKTDWLRASDHYSFHQADIPWLYLGVPVHHQYHQPSDTLAKLDLTFIGAVSETSFELLQLNRQYFNK